MAHQIVDAFTHQLMLRANLNVQTPEPSECLNRHVAHDQRPRERYQTERSPDRRQPRAPHEIFPERPNENPRVKREDRIERPPHLLLTRHGAASLERLQQPLQSDQREKNHHPPQGSAHGLLYTPPFIKPALTLL